MNDVVITAVYDDRSARRNRLRIKICGITNPEDAIGAIEAGADTLGFNFYPGSPRAVNRAVAGDWLGQLPPEIVKVAVVVSPTIEEAMELAELPFIDALQLHGGESPQFCRMLADRGYTFVKAIAVGDPESLSALPSYSTRTVLLDSRSAGYGGSGRTFPWQLGAAFVNQRPDLQVVLAGGLTPENVGAAVREVLPFGVDVTSGVESEPGRKDFDRMRAFVQAARSAAKQLK